MFLNRIKDNKNIMRLIENFVSLSALQLINIVIPLITLPYILRVIGLEKYGVVVMAFTMLTFLNTLTDYSFKITGVRETAIHRSSNKKLNFIYSKIVCTQMFLVIISTLILILIVICYKPFYDNRLIYFLTIPMLFGYTLFPDWFFQGVENMKYMAILTSGIKLFFTGCIFLFLKTPNDSWMYPLFNSLGYIGASIIGQYILYKKYSVRFTVVTWKVIKRSLKSNFPVFVNQFAPNFYNGVTTILLGVMTNNVMVGLYDAIKKVTELALIVINIISRVCFPFLNRAKNAFPKYELFMMVTGAILAILPIFFSSTIFEYLGVSHVNALSILVTLSLGVFFYSLYNIYGLNYFIINHKDKYVMKNTLVASIIGFIVAYPLIKFFGVLGAAANLTFSRGIMGIGMFSLYYVLKSRNGAIKKSARY